MFRPATTITSQPDFLPTHIKTDSTPVTLKRNRRTLNLARGFGVAARETKCIVCKTEFGLENPHGADGAKFKLLGDGYQWFDINNLGATEIAVRLRCGNVTGSNCILPYLFCPRCQACFTYSECGHTIPLQQTNPLDTKPKKNVPTKCLHYRVLNIEKRSDFSALPGTEGPMRDVGWCESGAGAL